MSNASEDKSNGYEQIAHHFIAARNSRIGPRLVREWAQTLPAGAAVLDLACGHGVPLGQVLVEHGFDLYAVDASPTLLAEYKKRFPHVHIDCATAEESDFFARAFDGVLAWGLMFLLPLENQRLVINKVARALKPGGKFLFTSVKDVVTWNDSLTGRESVSAGVEWYRHALREEGLLLEREESDEGENYNFFTSKSSVAPCDFQK
jgi:2-polyprenyl-3-methyl-5-hydroxy-6-metoxy-1,4-benzoquinol methylase